MAEPTQKRNATLTFAAAGATIGIILAILAGPSVVECSSSTLGFGDCLRDKVAGLGLLPPRETAPEPAVVAEPETSPAEQPESEPAPETVALTLLRATPDGSLVLGGRGRPGEDITIFANGAPLGSVTPEPSGDWAFVPDAPLAPGGTEITVGTADGAIVAPEAFVVIIDEQPAVEARVLPSTPGRASEVLGAVPLAAQPGAEPAVAATPEPEATAPASESIAPDAETVAEPATEPTADVPPAPEIDQAALAAGKSAAEAAAGAPVTVVADAPAQAPEMDRSGDIAAVPDEAAFAAGKAAADTAIASPVTQVAALPAETVPAETAQAPDPNTVQLALDAGRSAAELALAAPLTIVAASPPLVDLAADGETAAEAGRTAAALAIAAPVTVVAALPDEAEAVPRDVTASEAGRLAAAEALANPVTQETVVAAIEPEMAALPEPEVAATPATPPTIDAIEIDGEENYFAGGGEEGATIRLYVEDVYVGDSKVEGGRWLVEAERTLTRPSQRIRVEMLAPTGDKIAGASTINFVIDLPTPEGAEPAEPPDIAAVTPEGKPEIVPHSETERSLEVAATAPAPADTSDIDAADEPSAPQATPNAEESSADTARSAERGETVLTPPVESLPPAIDVAAVEAGQSAVDAALLSPVTVRTPAADLAPPLDQAALEAGAAAAAAAAANPVPTKVADVPAVAVESAVDPAVAFEAGQAAAELALLAPVAAVSPALDVALAAPVAEEPTEGAATAGAEAAELALAAPVTVPVPELSDGAVEAGAEAAEIALANPLTIIVGPAVEALELPAADVPAPEAAAMEPEVAVAAPAPVGDNAAAAAAGEAAAEVAAASPVEVPASIEEEIPTLTAVPVGDADLMRFATGKVIIRRGDTLWDIAERVYGSGTKYRTIYRANRNQIRRPGRIYPGQVFDLPVVFDD